MDQSGRHATQDSCLNDAAVDSKATCTAQSRSRSRCLFPLPPLLFLTQPCHSLPRLWPLDATGRTPLADMTCLCAKHAPRGRVRSHACRSPHYVAGQCAVATRTHAIHSRATDMLECKTSIAQLCSPSIVSVHAVRQFRLGCPCTYSVSGAVWTASNAWWSRRRAPCACAHPRRARGRPRRQLTT